MYLTTDTLMKLAAETSAIHKNGHMSLTDSIVKTAMDNEMSPDQVKRLIESSNNLSYLAELETNPDRTFELDVANYDDVISKMINPTFTKEASESGVDHLSAIEGIFSPMEKAAHTDTPKLSKSEQLRALEKVASQERVRLNELREDELNSVYKLAELKSQLSRDPDVLVKMASFNNGKAMARLVFGHDTLGDASRSVWSDEEITKVAELSTTIDTIKQAKVEADELQSKVEMAESIIKEAFVSASVNAAKAAGKLLKSKTGKVGAGVAAAAAPVLDSAKKTLGAVEAVDSTRQVSTGTNRKYNVWSSLRG